MRKILFIICWALAGVGLYSCSLDDYVQLGMNMH